MYVIVGGTVPGLSARPSALVLGSRRIMSSYSGESRHNHHWVAHRLHHVCMSVCLGNGGGKGVIHATHTNTYKQSHAGCEECNPHSMCKLNLRYSVTPNILALRGVSRSTGDETRQPADFNRVASLSQSLSLPPCTGAKPMGCGQCACCRRLRVSSCWCCSPDRGRPDEPFWWVRGNYVAGE